MKQTYFYLGIFIIIFASCTSSNKPEFNLDFEKVIGNFPIGLERYGDSECIVGIDSLVVKQGKYAVFIENCHDDHGFTIFRFPISDVYEGKRITLSGYIKTESVTDGYGGLYLRIDPDICMETMSKKGISGTTDWTKYEITAELVPHKTVQTFVGGILVGKGKIWFDNLRITIDGKDITNLSPVKMTKLSDSVRLKENADYLYESKIKFDNISDKTLNNLDLLGRLWGFLKYHHPAIARGEYNWDYELFRILPSYLQVKNDYERNRILTKWIDDIGNVRKYKSTWKTSEDAILKPDHSWIEKYNMDSGLQRKIKIIYENRDRGEQYYVRRDLVGTPNFISENPYSNMKYPDAGYRLLALYRYWNVIQYFYPYKDLIDRDWNHILEIFIPRFLSADNELAYQQVVAELVACIDDSHGFLYKGFDRLFEWMGSLYAPIRVRFVEGCLVVDYIMPSHSRNINIKVGDIITHINGKEVQTIVDSLKKYFPASNQARLLRDISQKLLRSNDKSIDIKYKSEGRIKKEKIWLFSPSSYDEIKELVDRTKYEYPSFKLINHDIGYITLSSIENKDIPRIRDIFEDTKGIIIDIRNYPSAITQYSLGSFFTPDTASTVRLSYGTSNNPGEFTFGRIKKMNDERFFFADGMMGVDRNRKYKGNVVVIVNEETISSAEYHSIFFSAGKNVTILGSQTAGADGDAVSISLPGGLFTSFSSIGVYLPNGKVTQRIGIIPDIVIEPTIEGVRLGKDELLEKAIEIITHK